MILFSPTYNNLGGLNQIANSISHHCTTFLESANAVRINLLAEAARSDADVLIMSHGEYAYPCGEGGDPAILDSDLGCYVSRKIFSYSCNTEAGIGKEYGRIGGIWFGYDGAISAPKVTSASIVYYTRLFNFIINGINTVTDSISAEKFINDLKIECDLITNEIISTGDFSIAFETGPIRHVWERLRIVIPQNKPDFDLVCHQESTEGIHRPYG